MNRTVFVPSVLFAVVLAIPFVTTGAEGFARFPDLASQSTAPIVLAQEQRMIRCTNACDRSFRRCGHHPRCRAEHNACIRACI